MIKHSPTLEQRIAVALQPDTPITSADVALLIEEAEVRIAETDKERAVERTLGLNPKAARQAPDAAFAANRLRTLLSRLQAHHRQLRNEEETRAWFDKLDAFKPGHDALVKELRERYPDAVATIVDLFIRIRANNSALSELLQARPAGVMEHLLPAELHARGLDHFSNDKPSLLTSVRLIDWETGREIWPPPQPSIAAAFATTAMQGYDRRFSGDWAKDNERRAAGQRAEQQRIADWYARQTREQEERQNAEARESFMAQQERFTVNRPPKP